MKFSEIIEPEGGYLNSSTSYFLILGIYNRGAPNPSNSGYNVTQNGQLIDPFGKTVDVFYQIVFQDYQLGVTESDSYPVWDSTSGAITQGSATNHRFAIASHGIVIAKEKMLLPPAYRFYNFGVAYGFWLTDDEVKQYVLEGSA